MYEPDILAAAYAIRAYHDGYRITGDVKWLERAVYWAETGVPFNYYWSLPQKPMMLGASIPVFGSTFYTHTWLAVPVQWCGLVYAWNVFHLAEELKRHPVKGELGFAASDWRRLVELLTVSGMYQQCTDEKRLGTYPDSIGNFENRNPVFINPEDLMVNVLALNGVDPDIKTTEVEFRGRRLTLSTAARVRDIACAGGEITAGLDFYAGEISHSSMNTPVKPVSVTFDGRAITESAAPLGRGEGWHYDGVRQRLYISVSHSSSLAGVRIKLD